MKPRTKFDDFLSAACIVMLLATILALGATIGYILAVLQAIAG